MFQLSPTTTAEKTSAWLLCAELLLLIKIVTPKVCDDSLDAVKRYRVNVKPGPPSLGDNRKLDVTFSITRASAIALSLASRRTCLGTGPHPALTPCWRNLSGASHYYRGHRRMDGYARAALRRKS